MCGEKLVHSSVAELNVVCEWQIKLENMKNERLNCSEEK